MEFFEVKLQCDKNGFLDAKYGGNASKEFKDSNGYPNFSPAISWEEVVGAKSYALELLDYDSCPVVGKMFIHWVVGNIQGNFLKENASVENKEITQGVNSLTQGFWRSDLQDCEKLSSNLACSYYIGPMPPDKDHYYLFNVYALDVAKLELKKPFFISDLQNAMRGHIIGMGRVEFKYKQYIQ